MSDEHALKISLQRALQVVSQRLHQDASLGPEGGVAFRIGNPPVDVCVEWIEPGRCIAVYAPFPLPQRAQQAPELHTSLMKAHLAGIGTMGCSFWLTPEDQIRAGLTLIGPETNVDQLMDAIGRVEHMSRTVFDRMGP